MVSSRAEALVETYNGTIVEYEHSGFLGGHARRIEADEARAALVTYISDLETERDRYHKALETIKREYGQVCENFEVCNHPACLASYGSWATADEALPSTVPEGEADAG